MPYGFHGKILDIDLTSKKIKTISIPDRIFHDWLGGRGLGVYILWKELGDTWEEVDPLGEENLLLVLTGPLTGYYPGMKVCVTGKSPLSNGVVGSTVSSEVGIELKASGYDGLVLRGASDEPVYILINDDYVDIRPAAKYWGMRGTLFLKEIIKDIYPEIQKREGLKGLPKEPSVLYIGPAGENKIRFASVMAKWYHAAGYGGYGAVMGSKKVKAIIVKGSGSLPHIYDKDKVSSLLQELYNVLFSATTFRAWGTGNGGYTVGAVTSSEPIRNWQEEWHNNTRISVVNFETEYWIKKYHGDYGCPITCMKISYVTTGDYKGAVTDAPDYELMAYLGTNLDIFEPRKIIYLAWLADDLGVDGINAGNIMGFVAELFQRGILKEDDLGFKVKWGDEKSFARLLELIVNREGLGNILAEGTYRAALKLSKLKGENLLKYAVQVKGIGVGAHGIRSRKDYTMTISYAVSVQGGDHTSVATLPAISPAGELKSIFNDSAVICSFTSWVGFDKLIEFMNAVTGWRFTPDKWLNTVGKRILHIQRILLLLGGPDAYWNPMIHDDNPPRFYEPLPSGPFKGQRITREEVEELKKKYYMEVGYDEYGIPRIDVLQELGIETATRLVYKIQERIKNA